MKMALLTETQKDEIAGQQYAPDSYFNPIQDASNNWVISTQEQESCINKTYIWVKDLSLIDYEPKLQTNLMHE